MTRPSGRRNADYLETRNGLLALLREPLLEPGGSALSFREMAQAARTSPATLKHYFQDREGVLAASLAELHRLAAQRIFDAAESERGDVRASLHWFLHTIAEAWRQRQLGRVHALGLAAGLVHRSLGPTYLNEVLEPTVRAAESRLGRHVARGELLPCDLRHAALALLGPLVVGLLHQVQLAGTLTRPLDLEAFLGDHLEHFLRAYGDLRPRRS